MNSIRMLTALICVLSLGQAAPQGPTASAGQGPVVTVSSGQLRGELTSDGAAVFKNIPFAQPPVGDLRWKEPTPPKAWTGVRDATAFGPMCIQNGNGRYPHSEDCLQLNIWTPKWPMTSRVPVMVWFHGGGNTAGSAIEPSFNGESLARHGVVLVTTNYRLGLFGFFAHPELTRESPHHASGDYGLMDLIQSLRWVKENIARFGGDPANVTIFGESSGSADVNELIVSPLTKGLFVRGIAESGAASAQLPLADAERRDVEWAATIGISGDGALAKLRAIPAEELMAKISGGRGGPGAPARRGGPGAPGAPAGRAGTAVPGAAAAGAVQAIVVDGWVIPEQPPKIYFEGRSQKVGLMIGNNSQEMQGGGRGTGSMDDLRASISQRYGPLADRAIALYGLNGPGDPPVDPQIGSVATRWTTDNMFRCAAVQALTWHTGAGNAGYEFQFSRTVHGREAQGAAHASEIPFVFGTLGMGQNRQRYDDSDYKYSAMMQEYWVNFAKTGDPNGSGLVKWPRFDPASRAYLDLMDNGPMAKEGLQRGICDLYIENTKRQGFGYSPSR